MSKYVPVEIRRERKRRENEQQKQRGVQFGFWLHRVKDKAIIEKLNSVENRTDYIRRLILEDLAKEKGE